jgi:hypothetical protein
MKIYVKLLDEGSAAKRHRITAQAHPTATHMR